MYILLIQYNDNVEMDHYRRWSSLFRFLLYYENDLYLYLRFLITLASLEDYECDLDLYLSLCFSFLSRMYRL